MIANVGVKSQIAVSGERMGRTSGVLPLLLAAGLVSRGAILRPRRGANPGLDAPAGSFVAPAMPSKKERIRAKRARGRA